MKTTASKTVSVGSVVRPMGDGEDNYGRVIKNSDARLRVTAVYGGRFDAAVIKPGGMWRRGGRMLGLDVAAVVVVNDIADRPIASRRPSIRVHVAPEGVFDVSYASHLADLAHSR